MSVGDARPDQAAMRSLGRDELVDRVVVVLGSQFLAERTRILAVSRGKPHLGDFTQNRLSLAVTDAPLPATNDGCPISARFWQMWDSTDLDP